MTYGTVVSQLCVDYENDYAQVNQQLEKMGYNIGIRLIEDFLAKTSLAKCGNFRETADTISKVRCPSALGGSADQDLGGLQDLPEYHAYSHKLDRG